jgi:succinoglycan biosynthesis transport protein ExoP
MTSTNAATAVKQERKATGLVGGLEYYTLRDYRMLLWRRKWTITSVTLSIALLVSVVAYRLPNEYQATSVIMVDPGKVPESYVKSTATIDANQRLAILQEQILSDTRLGQIIDELGLYRGLKATKTQDAIVSLMTKKIAVEATTTAPPARALKSFNVSFTAPTAVLAAKVSNRLASLFIEENLKVREQQVLGTADFFDRQLEKGKQDLDEKAQKLAQLRAHYATQLPESQNLHLQALSSAQLELREETDAVSRAQNQKAYLQSLVASSPSVVDLDNTGSTANTGLEEQLERLQGEMDQLRTRYGPSYPDVLSKAADIESVKQKITELEKQGKAPATSGKHNPAVEGQITQVDEEMRRHQSRQAELESLIKFHEAAIQSIPGAQEQLTAATNDLAVTSDRYKRLEDRKFGADMFSDVEARQQGERFVLLDPAQPPEHPSFPNRPLIDGIGAGAGLAIALFLVVMLEIFDSTVKTERELRERLKAPVLGEIPRLSTKSQNRRRRLWAALAATVNLVLALGYGGLLVVALR